MSSLKSTPRRIVTNFFFGLNAACKPPRRPHSNTPPASQPFPSRPEGAEAPSPGHSPWVFMSPRLAPCRGKSLVWRPKFQALLVDSSFFFFMLRYACWWCKEMNICRDFQKNRVILKLIFYKIYNQVARKSWKVLKRNMLLIIYEKKCLFLCIHNLLRRGR